MKLDQQQIEIVMRRATVAGIPEIVAESVEALLGQPVADEEHAQLSRILGMVVRAVLRDMEWSQS